MYRSWVISSRDHLSLIELLLYQLDYADEDLRVVLGDEASENAEMLQYCTFLKKKFN